MMMCNMISTTIENRRLKENYMLLLETCHLEDVDEDIEQGDHPLLEKGVEVKRAHLARAQ